MGRCLGGRGALQERKAGDSSRVCLVSPLGMGAESVDGLQRKVC